MALRRSQRISHKITRHEGFSDTEDEHHNDFEKEAVAEDDDSELGENGDNDLKPSTKLRKTGQPRKKKVKTASCGANAEEQGAPLKRRSMRGILQQIKTAPLDVIFEIFSYLEPLDLLRLSRLTKDLRELLMTKSNAFVWEHVRRGVEGLPPKFDDLNEVQYAHLLFDTHCHSCDKAASYFVVWAVRLRLCRACLEDQTKMVRAHNLRAKIGPSESQISSLVPTYKVKESSRRYGYYYPLDKCIEYKDKLLTFGDDVEARDAWCRAKRREANSIHTYAYETWLLNQKDARSTELSGLRRERLQSILERLRSDGWETELKDLQVLGSLRDHKLVWQPKALTERIWLNIKPTLTQLMEESRMKQKQAAIARRKDLFSTLCSPVYAKLPSVQPPLALLETLEPFVSLINDTPPLVDITEEDFAPGIADLAAVCAAWREDLERHLQNLLRRAGQPVDLSLISSVFTCSSCKCSDGLFYPDVATHRCFTARHATETQLTSVWRSEWIEVCPVADRMSFDRYVILSGLDPATATVQDMDNADVCFKCEDCPFSIGYSSCKGTVYMRWRAVKLHDKLHQNQVVREEDSEIISLAVDVENSERVNLIQAKYYPLPCKHCYVLAAMSSIAGPIFLVHDISLPAIDVILTRKPREGITDDIVNHFVLPTGGMHDLARRIVEKPFVAAART